jgi:hypothetical protein
MSVAMLREMRRARLTGGLFRIRIRPRFRELPESAAVAVGNLEQREVFLAAMLAGLDNSYGGAAVSNLSRDPRANLALTLG